MKPFVSKIYRSLLALLGFTACSTSPWDEPLNMYGARPAPEYGTPHVNYVIRGTVTDNDGNPLPGIKVKPLMGWWSDDVEKYWGNSEDDPRYYGVFHTDADGKVEVITSLDAWDAENEDIRIAFEDEDGPQNGGSFARDTLFRKDLDIQKVSDGDGHWLEGKYQIDFQKKLSPEEE